MREREGCGEDGADRRARFVSEGKRAVRWARARRRASERAAGTGRPSRLWAGSGAGHLLSGVRDAVACRPNRRWGEELGSGERERGVMLGLSVLGRASGAAGPRGLRGEREKNGPAGWVGFWFQGFLPLFYFYFYSISNSTQV